MLNRRPLKSGNMALSALIDGVVSWFLGTWTGPLLLVFLGLVLLSDFKKLQSFSFVWSEFSNLLLVLIGLVLFCRVWGGIDNFCVFLEGTPLFYYIIYESGCRTHTNVPGGLLGVPQLGSPDLAGSQLWCLMGGFVG